MFSPVCRCGVSQPFPVRHLYLCRDFLPNLCPWATWRRRLVLALCVTPTLCYFFIKAENNVDNENVDSQSKPKDKSDKFYKIYETFLHWILSHKAIFMIMMVITLVISLSGFGLLKKQFFPDSDRTQVVMYIDLPNGTSARETAFPFTRLAHMPSPYITLVSTVTLTIISYWVSI